METIRTDPIVSESQQAKIREFNRGQRLTLAPVIRVTAAGVIASGYGLTSGFYRGFQHSALQYLAENAHRMPTTKGGWYFYHKRKNYVMIKDGLVNGLKRGGKYGFVASLWFGAEAYLDHLRGTIDFFNTIVASGAIGYGYGAVYGLSRGQAWRSSRATMMFGAFAGLMQDFFRYKRGNQIWYIDYLHSKFS